MSLFDSTLWTLERALDARLARHVTLAGNLANANTADFAPKEASFQATLRQAEAGSPAPPSAPPSPGHLDLEGRLSVAAPEAPHPGAPPSSSTQTAPDIVAGEAATPGLDGNRVDPDRTLAAIAQNALQYGAAARAAGKKLAILRYVASDGNA
ncbi:MAG TPA: flagellar biosynthesis protein FlgB [Myxococcales bacterium]|nr:flagellar biosynthesis protein FlgB [Myxococcales bacterium]